jgi:hypothetical protein
MPLNPLKMRFLKTGLDLFTSTRVVLFLFALLLCFLIPLTIFKEVKPLLMKPVTVILVVIGFNLLICTLRRLKSLRYSTLVIHLGFIIILAGGLVSMSGFVATVNVYEGDTIDTVFNWDVGQDVSLGYELRIAAINLDFYPVPVRIGVLRNGRKAALFETRTDDFFVFAEYRVQVLRLDPLAKVVYLAVASPDGEVVTTMSTGGPNDLPPDFPLDFKLVAFQNPKVRRMWVDLELRKDNELAVAGTSEVNQPLRWQGMKFFLTQVAADSMGRPYAGMQISRDPGVPYDYVGFAVLCLGLFLALGRLMSLTGGRKSAVNEKTTIPDQ